MRCDIFIKSWYNDLSFLSYCLRFLEKNWREPSSLIHVLCDEICRSVTEQWRFSSKVRYYFCQPWPDGYSHAMTMKALADEFTDADYILFFDSDIMLVEPMTRYGFMVADRPVLLWIEQDQHDAYNQGSPWGKVQERVMKARPNRHYVYLPTLYHRSTFAAMRKYLVWLHRKPFFDIAYSGAPFNPDNFTEHPITFCEHDTLGAYSYLKEADRYEFRHVRDANRGPTRQYHSWSQWNTNTQTELETMLLSQ